MRDVEGKDADETAHSHRRLHLNAIPSEMAPLPDKIDSDIAQRLAVIVESSDDAIISKNKFGIITSWNRGAERIFGYKPEEIIGASVMRLIPEGHHDEEPEILARLNRGERINHYETVRRRKDGELIDVSLTVSPIRDADGQVIGAAKIARDITERKRAERKLLRQQRRLEQMERISKIIAQNLDPDSIVQTVTDIATGLCGAQFGAFFYYIENANGEKQMLFMLSGAPREAFEKFGLPRATQIFSPTYRGCGVVRSDDITADPRYGHNPPHYGLPKGHLPVVSYLAVPVIGREGGVLGGLFFGHGKPGMFAQDDEDSVVGIAAHAAIALENARLHKAAQDELVLRRQVEQNMELLLKEMQHRVKNTMATVQAIAGQTFRGAPRAQAQAFTARIMALDRAHDLLVNRHWDHVPIEDVVDRALAPFRENDRERIRLSGPRMELPAGKALLLAMVLHELGTNAVKYGALSNSQGLIDVAWRVPPEDGGRLFMSWGETGGPPVSPPTRKGFGSVLIQRVLKREHGNARLSYSATGFSCEMEFML